MSGLTIGKLATKGGVSIDTVRFYEKRGLIPEPLRTPSNYRVYPEEEVARLKFIKKAKGLGFSLNEIKELLALRRNPAATKAEVKARTESKIKDITIRIADLSRILAVLEHLAASCDGQGPAEDCPILEALGTDDAVHQRHQHAKEENTMSYYFSKSIEMPFEQAVQKVAEELKKEGFGILTDIDVKKTLKKKLDVEFQNYRILGACNPPFAYKALQAEDKIGAMLPCNVIVQEISNGKVEVAAVDPVASMQAVDNPALAEIAAQIQAKLRTVINNL